MNNLKIDLKNYQKNRVDKLDAVTTGINIERRHKVFIESHGVNLSAVVRDIIEALMAQSESEKSHDKK